MTDNKNYFDYLKRRSFFGGLYRSIFLYPIISKRLEGRLLDVGCGIGDMISYRTNSIGVDINQYNVNYCISRGCEAHLMKHDALPFKKSTFESVLLDNVLEHIHNPFDLLADIKRVLKPNGLLVVGVPGLKGFESDSDHKVYYDQENLKSLANLSGFEIKEFFYTPLFKSFFLSKYLKQYCIYSVWMTK